MHSLRGRLTVLFLLLVVSSCAAGALMLGLFQQSMTARTAQAQSELGRACESIASEYRAFVANESGPGKNVATDAPFKSSLTAVVEKALRNRPDIEGGIRQNGATSLAYAYPSYQGGGVQKTDEPPAELSRIGAANGAALDDGRPVAELYETQSQVLLIAACPLDGPISKSTAWAMTRVNAFAGPSYNLLMGGFVVLFAALVTAAILLARLTRTWTRRIGEIEDALKNHDVAELPRLAATGERELDRIVNALSALGQRLTESRRQADELSRQLAAGERLAALGRVAAGVAHEIRNPIAAMRLKAESALAGDMNRRGRALSAIVAQIDRLDALVARIVSGTGGNAARVSTVPTIELLRPAADAVADRAKVKGLHLRIACSAGHAAVDPAQILEALQNLLLNAIEASPRGGCIQLIATHQGEKLVFSVTDEGPGVPSEVRAHLFEPFASGRPDGTGLGLAVVREVAKSHRGIVRLAESEKGAAFEMILPCRMS